MRIRRRAFTQFKELLSSEVSSDVHDLRVLIRKQLAIIWLYKKVSKKVPSKEFQELLRELMDLFGNVRTLDIAIKDAQSLGFDAQKLMVQRKKAIAEVSVFWKSKKRKYALERIDGAYSTIKKSKLKWRRAKKILSLELKKIEKYRIQSKSDLHKLRIKVKRLRYIFESLGYKASSVKRLQHHLGRLHDFEVLKSLIKTDRRLDPLISKELSSLKKTLYPALSQLHAYLQE